MTTEATGLTDRQKEYRLFLTTEFWRNLSRQQLAKKPHCAHCNKNQHLQAHHIRYPEDWFDTTLLDLETLCRRCHELAHGINRPPPMPLPERLEKQRKKQRKAKKRWWNRVGALKAYHRRQGRY